MCSKEQLHERFCINLTFGTVHNFKSVSSFGRIRACIYGFGPDQDHLQLCHGECSTPAGTITNDAHTCEKQMHEIELNLVLALQDPGSFKAPLIIPK